MARRGQKMNLGEFLGDKAAAYIPEAALPTGPRVRAEGEEDSRGGYGDRRGGDRFSDRAPSRSDESGQWRGDRSGDRGGDRGGDRFGDRDGGRFGGRGGEESGDNWRGSRDGGGPSRYDRPSRDNFQAEERPAHMRLNLQRRADGDEAPRGGAGFNSRGGEEAPRGGDKFASAFGGSSSRSGDRDGGSRFGDRDGGSRFGDRDGGSRFGGDRDGGSRFGGDRDGGRFGGDRFGRGDRYDDRDSRGGYSSSRFGRDDRRDDGPVGGIAAAFQNSMRMTDNIPVQQEAPVDDKKARAAKLREERKKKAEEERLAAEEAKRAAAEAKKAAEEAAAKKAEGDRAIIDEVLVSGKLGEDLAKVAKDVFAKQGHPSGGVIVAAVTEKAEAVAKSSANWIAPGQYGALLQFAMEGTPTEDQVKALYALQIFLNEHDFPKGVMEKCFMALYTLDIIEDKAFFDYKYDVDNDAPGRMKAIVQTSTWLAWLETPEEEGSDEDDE